MSNASAKQGSLRTATGTQLTYEGDWHAYWDSQGVATGPFDGRMLAWINAVLSTTYTSLPQAQQAYAVSQGAYNWDSLGPLSLGGGAATAYILLGDGTSRLLLGDGSSKLLQ